MKSQWKNRKKEEEDAISGSLLIFSLLGFEKWLTSDLSFFSFYPMWP